MSLELTSVLREALGSLSAIAESLEKTIESIKRTSGSISSSLEKRKLKKISDALAKFYFSPVGIRMDIANYITDPSQDNLYALEHRLEENQELIRNFSEFIYRDMDANIFNLPMSNIDYLFGVKSNLHMAIYNSRYELEGLTSAEKNNYLEETAASFDEFNKQLEETIKKLNESIV